MIIIQIAIKKCTLYDSATDKNDLCFKCFDFDHYAGTGINTGKNKPFRCHQTVKVGSGGPKNEHMWGEVKEEEEEEECG